MSTFIYEAYDSEGVTTHGEYDGTTRDEVIQYLVKRDLTPVSVEELRGRRKGGGILEFTFFERLNPIDVMFLVRNLATTVKAGLSIVESLDILIADTEKKMMKRVLHEAQASIKNGQPLSSGFEKYKDSFPPIFMGMLKAGELSGQLDKTLAELGRYLSKEYTLRSKIKSALTYPIILLVAATAVMILLLIFVLPRLTASFAASGVKLPFITEVFLNISKILTWSFTLDIAVLAALVWFLVFFRTTNTGKKFFFWIISHMPVANNLVKKVALVRFARTFGNLIGSGISAIEALELSSQSIGNHAYEIAIKKAILGVENGLPISESLGKFPNLFPHLLISLIVVGERTGSLHEIMGTFADFYEEEVDNTLKDLTAILEPALLLVMGLLVGAIAVSIILPIYQLVGNFV
ncbi:MAG: type II secretion system F family protein [Patescibacteria group bacterium]